MLKNRNLVIPVTLQVGVQRPVDPDNYFRASLGRFLANQMWVPPAEDIHHCVRRRIFDPYAQRLLKAINWHFAHDLSVNLRVDLYPDVYVFVKKGTNKPIASKVLGELIYFPQVPQCPIVKIEDVLEEFERSRKALDEMDLLDTLQMASDDIEAARWRACMSRFPWIKEFLR